ncbi:MAG: phosphatidylserine decarboxylase family protein [candidate division KSB1 bacterium]|nr:phosphatidylserine decarboxylase family protein [candidate division KSB1 bacterium]MDZ7304068.1 phosphatidylserine decarboxylase family protein [candidate division KSB1 bacterium]MDZ7313221.1 phosphatidylserine decarboxylase family protein [candidate division KSB1 bacterium]
MHREGYKTVFPLALAAIIFTLGSLKLGGGLVGWSLSVALWVFTALCIFFFRDPERQKPQGKDIIVSPADGTVIGIDEVDENQFMNGRARRVSIFMSVWNVHVNRAPMEGVVKYLRYQPGRFHVASLPKASLENEQVIIGIESPWGRILVKQIAGILARRVVCHLREGQHVARGERFGIIKFGSRLEVFVPLSVEIKIRPGEKVTAGESRIAQFKAVELEQIPP